MIIPEIKTCSTAEREKAQAAGRLQQRSEREVTKTVVAEGITPLDDMLRMLRDQTAETADRLDAAKATAPYSHGKMPITIVSPSNPGAGFGAHDKETLNLYMSRLQAEADQC